MIEKTRRLMTAVLISIFSSCLLGSLVILLFTGDHLHPDKVGSLALVLLISLTFLTILSSLYAFLAKTRAENIYHELVEHSNSIILRMDENGNILFLNDFGKKFFGFSDEEIVGKNVIGTIVPKTEVTGKNLETMIKDIVHTPHKYITNFNENIKKNGERAWILWTNTVVPGRRKGRHVLCIGNDMTRIKEAENKLKEALDMKNRFISMASHELRSPLATIKGSVELFASGHLGPLSEQQSYWITKMKGYIERLNRIADDILTIQKMESGKMVFEMQDNDLAETILETAEMMKIEAEKRGLALTTDLAGDIPKFKFDKDRIIQVLINLVNNAIKFTDKGYIKISACLVGGQKAQVAVSDSGCGMDPKDVTKIFEKFEQLNNARERKTGGTGLGLSIAKEIILHHDGTIRAESELGKGSSFIFLLPVKK